MDRGTVSVACVWLSRHQIGYLTSVLSTPIWVRKCVGKNRFIILYLFPTQISGSWKMLIPRAERVGYKKTTWRSDVRSLSKIMRLWSAPCPSSHPPPSMCMALVPQAFVQCVCMPLLQRLSLHHIDYLTSVLSTPIWVTLLWLHSLLSSLDFHEPHNTCNRSCCSFKFSPCKVIQIN